MRKCFKKISVVLVVIFIFATINIPVFAAVKSVQAYQDYKLWVRFNGVKQRFMDSDDGSRIVPLVYNERSYLPVRAIANLSRLNVDYDEKTHTVLLTSGGNISLDEYQDNSADYNEGRWIQAYQDYSLVIKFNGAPQTFTDPDDGSKIVPLIYNGRSYLPVRAIANLAGLNVDYDEFFKEIVLTNNDIDSFYNIANPMYNVSADKEFVIKFQQKVWMGWDISKHIRVYSDPGCTNIISAEIDVDTDKKTVTVKPPKANLAPRLKSSEISGIERAWGGYPRYYLVVGADFNSTETKLFSKPLRMMFTIASQAEIPNLKFEVSENGLATLYWEPIMDASEYRIYHTWSKFDSSRLELLATTKNTEYSDFSPEKYSDFSANLNFQGAYYLTAVVNGKESRISDIIDVSGLESQVPSHIGSVPSMVNSLEDLPKTVEVEMKKSDFIDGKFVRTIKKYKIIYDYENIKKVYDSQGNIYSATINYTVPGTIFKGSIYVSSFDEDKAAKASKEQEAKPSNNGVLVIEDNIPKNPPPVIVPEPDPEPVIVNDQVPEKEASTPLEETLKNALLNAETEILLADYPEAGDTVYLTDLLLKVIEQNPKILYLDRYGYDYYTKTLYVGYSISDKKLIKKKQEDIDAKVKEIVEKVIKPGMSDYEKEKALHDYLTANGTYDLEALKIAEVQGFQGEIKGHEDSFNPYGILINGVGVCASYAGAFKLLADEANLDAVVVTGDLGNVPHAWNKVELEGMYYNLDATNNDDRLYPVFNASDKLIAKDFSEGDDFELDQDLPKYASTDNKYDYYFLNNLTASSAQELKDKLNKAILDGASTFNIKIVSDISDQEIINALQDVINNNSSINGIDNCSIFASVVSGEIIR